VLTVVAAALAVALGALAALAAGTLLWVRRRVFVARVVGESMLPTLRDGDRMLALRTGRGRVPAARELVVLRDPQAPPGRGTRRRRPDDYLVKRVAAVAGDPLPAGIASGTGTVPEGHLVLLGDNAEHSRDSRDFGPVPVGRIAGTVLRRMGR
jgi:signal peptidase I